MSIKIAKTSKRESANLNNLKPGDTFEDREGGLFLVTNIASEYKGVEWDAINLSTGSLPFVEDVVVFLVDLEVSIII